MASDRPPLPGLLHTQSAMGKNTHRAVIENVHSLRHTVVATGDQKWCDLRLREWIYDHPLTWEQRALLLETKVCVKGPPVPPYTMDYPSDYNDRY